GDCRGTSETPGGAGGEGGGSAKRRETGRDFYAGFAESISAGHQPRAFGKARKKDRSHDRARRAGKAGALRQQALSGEGSCYDGAADFAPAFSKTSQEDRVPDRG